jgi:hypothetical protein
MRSCAVNRSGGEGIQTFHRHQEGVKAIRAQNAVELWIRSQSKIRKEPAHSVWHKLHQRNLRLLLQMSG